MLIQQWRGLNGAWLLCCVCLKLAGICMLNVIIPSGFTLLYWLLQFFFLSSKNIVSLHLWGQRRRFGALRKTFFSTLQIRIYTFVKYSLFLSLGMFVSWHCLQLKELFSPSTDFSVLNTNLTNSNATLCIYFVFLHQWTAYCSCVWFLISMAARFCLWRVRHLSPTITAEYQRPAL